MNNAPMISVVMSVYNEKEEWLRESIDSILNQTYSDFEFIIINDNPSRELNTRLLSEYQQLDKRIVVIQNEENIGLTKSLNKGLDVAQGEYIARMDADDISMPTRFEKQVACMEANEDVVVCGTRIKYSNGKSPIRSWDYRNKSNQIAHFILGSGFAHPTVLIRAEALKANRISYDETFRVAQDYRLWSELVFCGRFYNIPEELLIYRVSDAQITSKHAQEQREMARKISLNIANRYLKSFGSDIIIPSKVSVSDFKTLRSEILKSGEIEKEIGSGIILSMYSLLDNDKLALVQYAKSLDVFRYNVFYAARLLYRAVRNGL